VAEPVRRFATTTNSLLALRDWLVAEQVSLVVLGRVDQVLDARGVAAAVSAVVETACSARWGWASESCAQRARVGEDGSDP
jgi:hypothetical protein